jgi:hypothetical protein
MSKQRRKRHTPEQIVAKLRDAPSCNSLLGSREAAKAWRAQLLCDLCLGIQLTFFGGLYFLAANRTVRSNLARRVDVIRRTI